MNNTTLERKEHDVVKEIVRILSKTNAIGISVEPIATMADPSDEVNGDYAIRACYWSDPTLFKEFDQDKRYCMIFEGSFIMEKMTRMDDARFRRNLVGLRKQAIAFRDRDPEGKAGRVITSNGIVDMGEIARKARRGTLQ